MFTPAGNHALGEVRKVLHGVRIADCPPELREKLAQYDTNGNGIIDPNELPDPMSAEMTYLKVSSFPKKVQPLLDEIDDEKNGKIELDELTEILTVYVDLKKANKEGSIAIKTLPKEIQATLKVFDVDGDGTVAPMELARGAELYKESKKTTKRLTIFSGVLLVILCALVGVIVGLTAVVVEASKETKTDSKTGITFAKGSSKPSATAKVTKTDSIYNAVKKSASDLRAIGSLTLGKPDGSSLIYSITGAETHGGAPGKANAVAFYSARGDVINVTATSLNVTKEDGTIVMTDTVVAEKSRRRRLSQSTDPIPPPNDSDGQGDQYYNAQFVEAENQGYYTGEAESKLTQNTETDGSAGTDCPLHFAQIAFLIEIKKLKEDFAAKDNEIASLKKDHAKKEQEIVENASGEIDKLRKDFADKENEIASLKNDLAAKEQDISKLKQENAKLKQDLDAKDACPFTVSPKVKNNDDLRERLKARSAMNRAAFLQYFGSMNAWDTSAVTDMSALFKGLKDVASFNEDISNWDTSQVTNMGEMFSGALAFNQDISKWDTSKVTSMYGMFRCEDVEDYSDAQTSAFNKNISGWDTSKVTDMRFMFNNAKAFNQVISKWNTAKVICMASMFKDAQAFNQDISNWDTSKVTDMGKMFSGTEKFNQDISKWDTSKVTSMIGMFTSAVSFNQDISKWNTAKVTYMSHMFYRADAFNQDISKWDTSQVTDMGYMFWGAEAFNQDISGWDTSKVTKMDGMFYGAKSMTEAYKPKK
ncbi:EF-hand domain-containing protein [Pycnococcus provasolii]